MYRYESLVSLVHGWVASGALKPGDRVLSVREMSAKLGYSAVTVHHAYGILEDEGILEARPRSGFFIAREARPLPEFSTASVHDIAETEEIDAVELDAYFAPGGIGSMDTEGFGSLSISRDLLPTAELYRLLQAHLRWEAAQNHPISWQGTSELRDAIAKRPGAVSTGMSAKDIVVTASLSQALNLCFELVAPRGSKVLIETPTDPSTVSTALHRKLEIVEIYSHPRFGIDPEQFHHLLQHNNFSACVLAANNHVPTGVSYPLETTKLLVEAATARGVPIIENINGQDLVYGMSAGVHLAQFDTDNLVLRVGSFADTMGPRFGLGWVALPRRYYAKMARQYIDRPQLAGEVAMQKAIADFLSRRSYERHLRKVRETLASRMRRGLSTIFQRFPESCAVSRPVGGYYCWIRGPKGFNAIIAAKQLQSRNIGFAPGPLFSVTRSFGNFIALNLSHPWGGEREGQLSGIAESLRATRS